MFTLQFLSSAAYEMGVIIGALVGGAIIGAVPAFIGAKKGKLALGLIGFVCCVIASFLLGMILSIPVCAIFIFLINKGSNKNNNNNNNNQYNNNDFYRQ